MDTTAMTGTWGPHEDWDVLMGEMKAAGGPLSDPEQIEELFRYDGTIIDFIRGSDGTVWLRFVHDEGDGPKEGQASDMLIATHHLLLDDMETARATLNDGWLPTVETYRLARTIVAERLRYVLEDRQSRECRGERRVVTFEQAMEDDPIYRQIRPDGTLVFGPFTDPDAPFAGDDRHLYRYPVPMDRVVAHFDGPRNWIGRFEDGPAEIHLIVCVDDEEKTFAQHRLSFRSDQEAAMLDTLAAGQAPTMDTYRLADRIVRERIVHVEAGWTITVQKVTTDDPDFEKPSFESVVEHDTKWPDFARRA